MKICPVCTREHSSPDTHFCEEHERQRNEDMLFIVAIKDKVKEGVLIPCNEVNHAGSIAALNKETFITIGMGTEDEYDEYLDAGILYTDLESFSVIENIAKSLSGSPRAKVIEGREDVEKFLDALLKDLSKKDSEEGAEPLDKEPPTDSKH